MIGLYSHLIAGATALVIGASGTWFYLSKSYGMEIEQLKHSSTTTNLNQSNQVIKDMAGFQKGLNDALSTFQATQQANTSAQTNLQRLLVNLRGTTVGLRSDFASLPERITKAAKPALTDFSEQCVAVFQSMADAGGQLAERGAEIARKADEHAANERLLHESWPVKSKQ